MALSDIIGQVKTLADQVEANPGKYNDVLDAATTAAEQMAALLGKLKSGDIAEVREALTQWDDVNKLLQDSANMDVLIAKGPGVTIEEVLTDAGQVLGVAARVGGLVLQFGPLFAAL